MAYTLLYSGNSTVTVTDGGSSSVGNVTLPGRNFLAYGQPVDQNFLSMTENFASGQPANPIAGQFWYDMGNTAMKYNIANTAGNTSAAAIWVEVTPSGSNASPTFGNITVLGNVNANTITTGSPTNPGTITGAWTLTSGSTLESTYADLAERHHADAAYSVGTVMTVGGINEVTSASMGQRVLGVVSTEYAYLMNSAAGNPQTHPAIAYVGRVPVRVVGPINKHDMIVPTLNGCARAGEGQSFGWALESNSDHEEKLVLCVIK